MTRTVKPCLSVKQAESRVSAAFGDIGSAVCELSINGLGIGWKNSGAAPLPHHWIQSMCAAGLYISMTIFLTC